MKLVKIRNLLMQILIIFATIAVFATIILLLSYEFEETKVDVPPYEYVQKEEALKTGKIKRSDLVKYLSLVGEVKRENNTIKEITVKKPIQLSCGRGTIINKASDISESYTGSEFYQGRVFEIKETQTEYKICIDVASNYCVHAILSTDFAEYVSDLKNGKMDITVQNNYNLLKVSLPTIEYDNVGSLYNLRFQISEIDEYTFSSMSVRIRIKETVYKSATYVDVSIIKEIRGNSIVLEKVKTVDGQTQTQEVSFEVLDIIGEKILINGVNHLVDNFIIFDRYQIEDMQ